MCVCVYACLCVCVHGFFVQFFVAALQFENILPEGVFQFCHILCIKLEKQNGIKRLKLCIKPRGRQVEREKAREREGVK